MWSKDDGSRLKFPARTHTHMRTCTCRSSFFSTHWCHDWTNLCRRNKRRKCCSAIALHAEIKRPGFVHIYLSPPNMFYCVFYALSIICTAPPLAVSGKKGPIFSSNRRNISFVQATLSSRKFLIITTITGQDERLSGCCRCSRGCCGSKTDFM